MKKANDTEGKFRVKSRIQRTKKDGSECTSIYGSSLGAPWRGVEKGHKEGSQKMVHENQVPQRRPRPQPWGEGRSVGFP